MGSTDHGFATCADSPNCEERRAVIEVQPPLAGKVDKVMYISYAGLLVLHSTSAANLEWNDPI